MIESINSIQQTYALPYSNPSRPSGSLMNFDIEDKAIISAEAKMLNELEKYNAGQGNEVDLAMAAVTGKVQVEAAATIIKTKDEMMDSIMEILE